jgi:hypothetical protein
LERIVLGLIFAFAFALIEKANHTRNDQAPTEQAMVVGAVCPIIKKSGFGDTVRL